MRYPIVARLFTLVSFALASCSDDGPPAVDAGRDGPQPGIHEVRPGQSIQSAIDGAKPGEEVRIFPGTYSAAATAEAFLVLRAARNGIRIRGAGATPGEVVLDGGGRVLHVIFVDQGIDRSTLIENLTVKGGLADPQKLFPGGNPSALRPELSKENDFHYDGAGLMLFRAAPTLRRLQVSDNRAQRCGAGVSIFCPDGQDCPSVGPLIRDSELLRNLVTEGTGGGIDTYFGSRVEVVNCLLVGNSGWGSAVAVLDGARAEISSTTIAGSLRHGIALNPAATVVIRDSIIAGSQDEGILLEGTPSLTVDHACFHGNGQGWSPPAGTGVLTLDPLFVKGPRGEHYLAQKAAGQPADSPCLDAGSTSAAGGLEALTTRSDGKGDTGTLDLGYHYLP
jgi:hypothetical protein